MFIVEMESCKSQLTSWSNDEAQTFISILSDEHIQRQLDGATRNEQVYQEALEKLAAHSYSHTYKQCRDNNFRNEVRLQDNVAVWLACIAK